MTATELLHAGRLAAALQQVTEEVRGNPGDTRRRIFLFELLCFTGDLERAKKHLEVAAQESADSEIALHRYFQLLAAETKRRQCFSSGLHPKLLAPASYAGAYFAALDQFRAGSVTQAAGLLEKAAEEIPVLAGTLNGAAFEGFTDANDLIGPFAELMIQGEYCWAPWEAVVSISPAKPKFLRDLMWLPVEIELRAGSGGEAFFPVLYVDSYLQASEDTKLGRQTEWRDDVEGLAIPLGQKSFVAGDTDYALLEIESLGLEYANSYAGE